MPLGLGFFAAAGAGGSNATFDWLETTTLGSPASSITFSSLGNYSSYKHLQLRCIMQNSGSQILRVSFNGTSGTTNYATHRLQGDGSSVSSQAATSADRINLASLPTTGNESNTFMAWVIDVLDFGSSLKNTTIKVIGGTSQASFRVVGLYSGLWNDTSSVTSITLDQSSGTLATNTKVALYGIK